MGHAGELELLILLAILRLDDDAYGVSIREELERETSRVLTLGSIYKTLGRMERKGLLQTKVAPPTKERGGRRKKLYALTAAGKDAARKSVADLHGLLRGLEPEFRTP